MAWENLIVHWSAETEPGKTLKYGEGGVPAGRDFGRLGFIAYPAECGVSGTRSFIVNENSTSWWKFLEDETMILPANPGADGWTKLD